MLARDVTISNRLGLHARAAAKLVNVASGYAAEVMLHKNGQRVNGKSIMGVMMLAASQGTVLHLTVDGEGEEQAMAALVDLIDNKFGEGE
ncbi:MAG: HPr family phosphocarrier protein [Chromatiaceae bacterium]|nr:HPr family phosphocarrier protein [Gammaproteobacteria bacterium]MCP5305194.1 HPr family phosphocarrier protein [Chromatiaceae bacterium]MCP5315153.1 HPr family phosphocarrier protein [Chromatiaceae bacterium]